MGKGRKGEESIQSPTDRQGQEKDNMEAGAPSPHGKSAGNEQFWINTQIHMELLGYDDRHCSLSPRSNLLKAKMMPNNLTGPF